MEVKLRDLSSLFVHPAQYEIPRFQRPYVWKQERQWAPLWEDVQNMAERILVAAPGDSSQLQPHFMGAVVLQQVSNVSGSLTRRIVVDGQQRLTTLQLLLDATRAVLERKQFEGPAARLQYLVLNQPMFQGGNADRAFKVWPTDADRKAFREAIGGRLSGSESSKSPIVNAHEFFKDQVEQWIHEGDGSNAVAVRAEALETALSRLIELVVIDLSPSDSPHIIFETLNARGTPLRQSDLVKNMILYEADRNEVEDQVKWPFQGAWWDEDIRQGRLYRPRIDVMLNYWLVMRSLREVGATDIFSSFGRLYKGGEQGSIVEIASDVASVGEAYQLLEDGALDGAWRSFIPRWKIMQAAATTPVLLWLLSSGVDAVQVARAIKALESYLVRRMVCRMSTRENTRVTVGLLRQLKSVDLSYAGDAVVAFLDERKAHGALWPHDNRVLDAIVRKPLYRLLTRARLRMVLEAIEEELMTSKAERGVTSAALTIEHIMPRGWRAVWPRPGPVAHGREDPDERRDRMVDSLGNLTLVSGSLNSALSNGPWHNKRNALGQHSTLFLNKDLLDHSGMTSWDESAIEARAMRLHSAFVRAWPDAAGILSS